MIENIGWIGSVLLALCALPEVYRSVKDKKCHVGWGLLLMWFFGEVLTLFFILATSAQRQLIVNYGVNILLISIMIYYKVNRNE